MATIIKSPRRSNPPMIIAAIAQIGIARLVPPLHTALREFYDKKLGYKHDCESLCKLEHTKLHPYCMSLCNIVIIYIYILQVCIAYKASLLCVFSASIC